MYCKPHRWNYGSGFPSSEARTRRSTTPSVSELRPRAVLVGGSPDVSRPAMRPTTSSRVSATSRISRPTSRVRARPADGGVWTNHARTPIAEASSRSRTSKENVSGPAASATEFFALRTNLHRLGRKVFGGDGLDRVVAVAVDGEHREAPQRPGHVIEQQVSVAEDQRRPDDAVGDAEVPEHVLHLRLAPEVRQV